jgi:hypothetical protein
MKTMNTTKLIFAAAIGIGLTVASCTPNPPRPGKDAHDGKAKHVAVITPPSEVPLIDTMAFEKDMRLADSMVRVEAWETDDERFAKDALRQPVAGGKATIYLQRGFLDETLSEMIRLHPFGGEGQERRVFSVTDSTHRRLEFKMTEPMRRGDGRKVTALDFVELWSHLLKTRPAYGLALFRHVQGAEEYVKGKEPLVGGFNAADEHTVRIRFAKPDPVAFARLNTPALIGGPFMLGAYYASDRREADVKLLPNANSLSDTAYLAECAVQLGGDPNALMSFSLGQYSAMTLYAAADLKIARAELAGKASLRKLPSDRYFLACRMSDEHARRFVRGAADGADLLNAAGAEGEVIFSVCARIEAAEQPRGNAALPQMTKPLRVIFRSDDPVSVKVAEKLTADLNSAGLASEAIGGNAETYEKALFSGAYECAVGWAAETALDNFTEQLHIASMWFAGETDSKARLREHREIPLFSVDNYLLLREDVRLYKDRLTGMWVDVGGKR